MQRCSHTHTHTHTRTHARTHEPVQEVTFTRAAREVVGLWDLSEKVTNLVARDPMSRADLNRTLLTLVTHEALLQATATLVTHETMQQATASIVSESAVAIDNTRTAIVGSCPRDHVASE